MKYSNITVHLDAGHASTTLGKRSPYSGYKAKPEIEVMEWKFNRDVVRILSDMLKHDGFNVNIITPENDTDVSLSTRYKRANAYKSKNPKMKHILISIHANAYGNGRQWNSARGWSAYTTKGQNNSDKLADCLYDEAEKIFKPKGLTIRTDKSDCDRDWESNFTIIYGANMPAVLTENFFYTNVEDSKYISTDEGKTDIATVHLLGIEKFCKNMKWI